MKQTGNNKFVYLIFLIAIICLSVFAYQQSLQINQYKLVEELQKADEKLTHEKLLELIENIPQSEIEEYNKNKKKIIFPEIKISLDPTQDPALGLYTDAYVLEWFTHVAPHLFTFDSSNVLMHINDQTTFFTEHGFNSYLAINNRSRMYIAIRENAVSGKSYFKSQAKGEAKLISHDMSQHLEKWFISDEGERRHVLYDTYPQQWAVHLILSTKHVTGTFNFIDLEIVALIKNHDGLEDQSGLAIEDMIIWSSL